MATRRRDGTLGLGYQLKMATRRPEIALPLSAEEVNLVITALDTHDPNFYYLPHLRSLLLGPYADSKLFTPAFCQEPTARDVDRILFNLEQIGLTQIAEKLQRQAHHEGTPAKRILDYLEALEANRWTHPTQVLRRPWRLGQVLELCRLRLQSALSPPRRERLRSIFEKLAQAQETEARAATRRQRRLSPPQRNRKRKKTP